MHLLSLVTLAAVFSSVSSLPASTIQSLPPSKIASFRPYTHYASAGYCSPSYIKLWNCGLDCLSNPSFYPVDSGGDGSFVQYWFVGYDSALKTVVVVHQGTDPLKIVPLITDVEVGLVGLDDSLFPDLPRDIRVHHGFSQEQSKTAAKILFAVNATMAQFSSTHVTLVGHSLGAALSLLDAVYLRGCLPSDTRLTVIGYGMPRVGNQAFVDYVDANIPDLTRINNREDPIVDLPSALNSSCSTSFTNPDLQADSTHGYHHPSGEIHIQDSGAWMTCPGQDNPDRRCSTGDINLITAIGGYFTSVAEGNVEGDHNGPYDGVHMSCGPL